MADYEGRVRLTADTSQADRELNAFVGRVGRPIRASIDLRNAGIIQAEQSFGRLKRSIEDLNKTPLNIITGFGAGSSAQSDVFRRLSKDAKDFFNSVASGSKTLASTTAGLRQQAAAFRSLADNINFTNQSQRRYFRDFAQGAEMARAKAGKAGIEELRALQDLYQSGVGGFGQTIAPGAGGLNQLLSLGKDLPRTKAALSEYRAELARVYDLVETRSLSGGIIAAEISSVEQELLKIEQDRVDANDQINNVKKASYALTRDQLSLEEENLALIERQAAARRRAQQATVDLYNRDRALSREFGVSPALTLRPAGVSDEEVARRNLTTDRTRAAAEESVFNAFSRQADELNKDLPTLKAIKRNRNKIAAETLREAQAQAKSANEVSAAGRAAEFRRTQGLSFDERLARRRPDLAAGGARSPQGFFRGSPRQAVSEGLIGGAFPLLFGQGLGASIGGAAGGVSGGLIGGSFGFGLSLIGTALGSAVDTTTNNLKELAASLKSPNDAITALEASGFRVGDSLKFQVEQLQSVGRAYDAQTLVLQEVERRLGAGSVQGLNALNAEQKRLNESWAELTGALQSQLIPALVGFTNGVNEVIAAVSGLGELPVVKQLLQARGALASTPLGRVVVPFALAEGQFQAAQRRGRSVAATAPARVPLTPQEAFASESTRIQESRRVADQIRSAYREAFQLQRQAYDLQREGADINREIADYSYRKQREIFDLRQQVAEREIENNRAAAQNRIERSDLSARQTFAAATGFEQQLLTNVREVMRTRQEGEADIEQSRRKLELAMAKLNRDVEDYKRTNAREIEDIERRKLAYTRSVEDYKMNVADYVLQRAREAADFMRQAMTLPEVGGGGGAVGGLAPYAPVSPLQRIPYMTEIDAAARAGNVDPRLLAGLVRQESNFNQRAVGSSGEIGLGQLMPSTARELGVNPQIVSENLKGAALYLRQMIDRFGSVEAGLRAYNQGPGAQQATPAGSSRESREYPGLVLGHARRYGFNPQAAVGAPGVMPGGVVARTGATGIGSGAHLDVRWADGRPITAADADRFIRVAGRLPSSYGVTSGYGPRRAPVPGASTFHRGVDFATPAGQPITLTGGARLTGAMTEAQSGGGGIVGIIETPMGQMKLLHLERVLGTPQATAAAQVSNIPQPRFNPVAVGATPSAAPINAERMAVLSRMAGSEQEAQRILEEQNKLRQKGIELAQVEQILQSNQLPQLEQQYQTLQLQIEARRRNLDLSDDAASVADIEAETTARIAQLEKDRANALAKVQKQYNGNADLVKQVNTQADLAINIAKKEEEQRRKNLDLNNKLQNQERVRAEVLQLQETLSVSKAEAAALERGEVEATAVELLMATSLYRQADEAQQNKLRNLTAETEELRKQNELRKEFNRQLADVQQRRGVVGAGLRSGLIGAGARAFEQGMIDFKGDTGRAMQLAQEAQLLESQQLIWDSLEKNIVDVSNAISGGLTNGLLDVISGAKKIEDVGREVLDGIARTFADAAQQQLSTLMQRKLASMLGGPEGPLTKMLGGASAAAGPQALGAASLAASNSVMAFGVALQTVTAQMGVSGALSGFGSTAASGIGSAFSSAAPNILGSFFPGASPLPSFDFGGFLANGGTAQRGKGYVVGDGGEPEFFFPGVTGRVVPRSDMEKAAALQ